MTEFLVLAERSLAAEETARLREVYAAAAALHASRAVSSAAPGVASSDDERQPGETAARLLLEMHLDLDSVAAALLAPAAVRGDPLPEAVRTEAVATLVDGVVRLSAIRWDRLDEEAAEALRRMFLAMAKDVRVVLILLALRVEALQGVNELEPAEQQRVAREALEIFAPLANRLGIWQFKSELEDAAFQLLEPDNYRHLASLLEQRREERTIYIAEVVGALSERLRDEGIEATVMGRPKHLYSIYKKMQRKQVDFDQIYDVSAVRVITDRLADCYAALGVIHATWLPIRGEFDDYVAMPKSNGYQSLHTAVVGPQGRPVEVQIRTRDMHRFAEFGVAAHWAYKEGRRTQGPKQDEFAVLRRLLDWERELTDPKQFVESLKTDVFEDQVCVFTPRGDVIDLPRGATPLDFAYRIHTLVGHRTRGARVNGQIVPLAHVLQTGDRVEILTHKEPHPSRDWMNPNLGYLKTASARAKVRHWFREQGRDAAIADGRHLIEKELHKLSLRKVKLEEIARALGFEATEELLLAVGYGDKSLQLVASTALELERAQHAPKPAVQLRAPSKRSVAPVLSLEGVPDVLGNRARCCNPLPGDDVVGFVTRGRGIVVHRRDCDNVRQSPEPERWIEIDWERGGRGGYSAEIEIAADPSPDLLNTVVKLLGHFGLGIVATRNEPASDGRVRLFVSLEVKGSEQLANALQRVSSIPEVESVHLIR